MGEGSGRSGGIGGLWERWQLASARVPFGAKNAAVWVVLFALLAFFAGILWASGVALRFRSIQAGPIMQMPVFIFLFFAPVYVPYALLEGWIQGVASVNPFTHIVEAGRDLLAGQTGTALTAYAIVLALIMVLSVWSILGLRSAERAG